MSYYIHIRHSVEDFDCWKAGFDAHADERKASGSKENYSIMRNINDTNEVVVLLEWSDLEKAKNFTRSPGLKEAMIKAGVTGQPDIRFLESNSGLFD